MTDPSAYRVDSLGICDEPDSNSGPCNFYVDLHGTITQHQADEAGSLVTYRFPESLQVRLESNKYFKVGLARASSNSQLLEAGGTLTNPIPYSDMQEHGGAAPPVGFDLYYVIETE